MNTANIVSYVIGGVSILIALFCLFKVLAVSRKVQAVSEFVNGEIFSSKFHQILTNYFSNEKYTKLLLDPLTPYIRDVIMKQCYSNDPEKKDNNPVIKDIAGMFFIE